MVRWNHDLTEAEVGSRAFDEEGNVSLRLTHEAFALLGVSYDHGKGTFDGDEDIFDPVVAKALTNLLRLPSASRKTQGGFDVQAFSDVLTSALKVTDVRANVSVCVELSAVSGSSYYYVYLYLTPAKHEGEHLVFSSSEEWGEGGTIGASRARHWEAGNEEVADFETSAEALVWALKKVREFEFGGVKLD